MTSYKYIKIDEDDATFKVDIVRPNGDQYPTAKNNRVEIPYGEEYAIKVTNLTGNRKMFKIFIDGESVSGDRKYILGQHESATIERYLEDDLDTGRKFQWLPLDHKEVEHKKDRPEVGMVKVRMWTEKYTWSFGTNPILYQYEDSGWDSNVNIYDVCFSTGGSSCSGSGTILRAASVPPQGATGRGGTSGQKFGYGLGFFLSEEVEERIFFLKPPEEQTREIEQGIEPSGRYCTRCGKKRKTNWVYCPVCGHSF